MATVCVGLQNPGGTISRFGVSAAGSQVETDLISEVTVPANDEHHITDFHVGVAKDSEGTLFKLYERDDASAAWEQRDELPVTDWGTSEITLGTSIKVTAGHRWRIAFIQTKIGRVSCRVGGQAKVADSVD